MLRGRCVSGVLGLSALHATAHDGCAATLTRHQPPLLAASLPAACAAPPAAEGEFIRRTAPVAFGFLLLAQAVGLIFTLGNLLPDKPLLDKL
jgi:hypothetical protein